MATNFQLFLAGQTDTGQARDHNEDAISWDFERGFALLADYEQERDGAITFTGHGVYTYDPKEDRYSLHWFDCMGSPPELFVGVIDADVLTLAHGGPGMHARMTYDFSTPDTMKGMMGMSQDGTDWEVLFEAVYTRV